jgi:hypothetical protein
MDFGRTCMKRWTKMALAAALLAGCGPAAERLAPADLGVTARDAFLQGRTRAVTWDPAARLRWMEGEAVSPAGAALPGVGQWRLHYTAPGRTDGLVVVVAPLATEQEEGPPVSPPGFVLGDAALGEEWEDSPQVMGRVLAAGGGTPPERATMLLVPAQPVQWVITFPEEARRWRLDARTGQVLGS